MEITITRTLGRKAYNNKPEQEKKLGNNSFDFHEGLAKIKRKDNDKWEFIDEKGNIITKRCYNMVFDFEDGLALVLDDKNRKGYIESYSKLK